MTLNQTSWDMETALDRVLGYLNFSSGSPDPAFLAALNWLYGECHRQGGGGVLERLRELLLEGIRQRQGSSRAFDDVRQAEAVVRIAFDRGLAAYRDFHSLLLGGHSEEELFQPFLLGRFLECLLAVGGPWDAPDEVVSRALDRFNDYVGLRPVAVLENQPCEPYRHEWFRPIPLYIQGAGVACGPYQRLVEYALEMLADAPSRFTRFAQFDLEQLEELAVDPRPFDFDHPASKAPNYYFGMWDPNRIDLQGRYRRFVLHEMTLGALRERVEQGAAAERDELEREAGVVLAGTILMASATRGSRPGGQMSTVVLAHLLAEIANFRDEFYEWAITRMAPAHRARLQREARRLHQPFGGARQHLNRAIADRRARQYTRLQLARIFLRLGLHDAANQQAERAGTASARLICRLECGIQQVEKLVRAGQLAEALERLEQLDQVLRQGIECGALADPWYILGFAAQYPLFSAQESIHDHRLDDLVRLIDQLFTQAARLWSSAAAGEQPSIVQRVRRWFADLVDWWRQFAAHESPHVEAPDPDAVFQSAERVAEALAHWQQAGAAAGDVAFWAEHVELFPSAEAYAHVVSALLERADYVAAMALLIHWLSRHREIGLAHGQHSFPAWTVRWLLGVADHPWSDDPVQSAQLRWRHARRFMELLEVNAEELWQVPRWDEAVAATPVAESLGEEPSEWDEEEEEGESEIYRAAYEGMIYRDQTDDGVDGSLADAPMAKASAPEDAAHSSMRLQLGFLHHVARLWKILAMHPGFQFHEEKSVKRDFWLRWWEQAEQFRSGLYRLAAQVAGSPLPMPGLSADAHIEYDQKRSARDALIETVVDAAVAMGEAVLWLRAALGAEAAEPAQRDAWYADEELSRAARVLSALKDGQWHAAERAFERLLAGLRFRPLLYLPIARGGDPRLVIAARTRRRIVETLLVCLPRSGLIGQSCQLLELARHMDRVNTAGQGAVTEFDELYELGFRQIVSTILQGFADPQSGQAADVVGSRAHAVLYQLRDRLARLWLDHSHMLRLSVVEQLFSERLWRQTRRFISQYGAEIFTQYMLAFGNIRAILHRGVGNWLEELRDAPDSPFTFVHALNTPARWNQAVRILTLIFEAICENYSEYRDYNSTTTQSDRGEKLFILLDFLRLKARFDRIWWNLRPITIMYELLARYGYEKLAAFSVEEMFHQVYPTSYELVENLKQLQRKYSVEMATIADRMIVRHKRILAEEMLRSLVSKVAAGGNTPAEEALADLHERIEQLAAAPCGAGFEMPEWLAALDSEVEQLVRPVHQQPDHVLLEKLWPFRRLPARQISQQVADWCRTAGPMAS
ncbi:MAG: hypothetical protein KatS3mg110_2788 [Pirellulaceae bacterium]|nr:MAG: hypothetical protein KatS3mg110_2788 [Pirellulaceae bacterium]